MGDTPSTTPKSTMCNHSNDRPYIAQLQDYNGTTLACSHRAASLLHKLALSNSQKKSAWAAQEGMTSLGVAVWGNLEVAHWQ